MNLENHSDAHGTLRSVGAVPESGLEGPGPSHQSLWFGSGPGKGCEGSRLGRRTSFSGLEQPESLLPHVVPFAAEWIKPRVTACDRPRS